MKQELKALLESHFLGKKLLAPYVFLNYWRIHGWFHLKALFKRAPGTVSFSRETPVIISLTTIPSRMARVHLCIESLLEQSLQPDHLILWLSGFEDERKIPRVLRNLQKRGLEIRYTKDIRSYRKLVPALREYPDSVLVTADDDVFYPPDWLKLLYEGFRLEPRCIHCFRAHYIVRDEKESLKPYKKWKFDSPGITGPSYNLIPTGCSGVLYPPNSLDDEVFNEEAFTTICPTADDLWFKAMSLKKGTMCKKVSPESKCFRAIRGMDSGRLWHINQSQNDVQAATVFRKYDLFRCLEPK